MIRLVDDAVTKGANLHTGGRIPPQLSTGWFYEPTVLTGYPYLAKVFYPGVKEDSAAKSLQPSRKKEGAD